MRASMMACCCIDIYCIATFVVGFDLLFSDCLDSLRVPVLYIIAPLFS